MRFKYLKFQEKPSLNESKDNNQKSIGKFNVVTEAILNEETLYKIDYNNGSGKYAYLIGNNNTEYIDKASIINYLNKQFYGGHESVSKDIVKLLDEMPKDGLICTPIYRDSEEDLEKRLSAFKEKDRFLNLTHSTARKHSPIIMSGDGKKSYLRHHLDGIEVHDEYDNILGIDMSEPYNLLHQLIHQIEFEDITSATSKEFNVCTIDEDGNVLPKKLIVTLQMK